jgi:HEAT repeat protein
MTPPLLWLAACLFVGSPQALGLPPIFPAPTAEEVTQQIQRLGPKTDKAERLAALRWITQRVGSKETDRAIPAVTRCVKEDSEPEVREEAVNALARLAWQRKQPCPVVLVEAILDKNFGVHLRSSGWVDQYPVLPPEAAPVLLRGARSDNPDVRACVLMPLGKLARKDKALLPALQERTKDKDWTVRNNAYVALYKATDRLDDYLGYLARERAAASESLLARKEESEDEKRHCTERTLLWISSAGLLCEWLEPRPKDLARTLTRMLEDVAASERIAGAMLLADFAYVYRDIKITPQGERGKKSRRWVPEFPTRNTPEVQAEKAAQLAKQMRELGVLDRIHKLTLRDPDKEVRDAAKVAFNSLTWKPERP